MAICEPRKYFQVVLFLSFIAITGFARSQSFDATTLTKPAVLNAKWRVQAGDDPAYARTDFDDSRWALFDPGSSITQLFPQRPPVICYRLRVKVNPGEAGLALNEWNISRAFEIYVNGERLISNGSVDPYVPYTFGARLVARIPNRMLAAETIVVAMRVHIARAEWTGQDPGFYVANLSIGQAETFERENWLAVIGEQTMTWLDHFLLILLGVVALVLYSAQRGQREYLWIAAMGAVEALELPVPMIAAFHNIPAIWDQLSILPRAAAPLIWTSLYLSFVGVRVRWGWKVLLLYAGVMNAFSGFEQYIPTPVLFQFFSNLPFITLLSVIVPIVLAVHWWRGNREAGILLIPVLLFSLYIYAEVGFDILFQFSTWKNFALQGLNFIDRYPAGPFAISLDHVSGILSTFSLAIIILLRSTKMSLRQAQLESEMAAAQEVQQLLVPEKTEPLVGFDVESVYQPAQEVGGDFFQILPARGGGLLVLVGDVAGKGLPAAMLVSVLVGAIRAVAEFTEDPSELLGHLNDRLVGRSGGGFSTALAARFAVDGRVTVCNAGHLPPYLDGKEVELPGALPLGVASSTRYETTRFHLNPGSRLTFYSDGVIEAQDSSGELFGFERAREISMKSAAEIVEAAKQFGQQDDITVVSITRENAADHARAVETLGDAFMRPQNAI